MATEIRKGDLRGAVHGRRRLRSLFGDLPGGHQRVPEEESRRGEVYLADYVRGLQWFYDPANRKKAIEITAEFTKSPADVLDSYFMTERDYYRDRNACVGVKTIQTPIDAMHSEGLIDKPVKVADHLNMSYSAVSLLGMISICVKDLNKRYRVRDGEVPALAAVDLDVSGGRVRHHRRAVRLRQEHAPLYPGRLHSRRRRPDRGRRQAGDRARASTAAWCFRNTRCFPGSP